MGLFEEGAALLDGEELANPVEVSGRDAEDYLQRMISGDLSKLTSARGIPSTMMTGKGKLIAVFAVLPHADGFLLWVDGHGVQGLMDTLEKLIILEDVDLRSGPELGATLSVQGPAASQVLARAWEADALLEEELSVTELPWEGETVKLVRHCRCRAGGWDLLVPGERLAAARERLSDAGAVEVSPEAAEAARIDAGLARFGIDATEKNLPPECGYDAAVSYDKGCYAGQEVVAR
ncbi:MAG: hypothetical protein V3T77_11685, partial [Planctomycetota bacterium]